MEVELRDIHKSFGSVQANAGINLHIPAGSIQGILGENGAGKSTLMKILSGFIQADKGEIFLDGKLVTIQTPSDAIRQGIGMLHQDPLDFPPMQVIDNFLIGHDGGLFPDRRKARKELRGLQKKFDFSLDPDAYVDSLTVGERQQLEILRLLWLRAGVLILDEPTTGISALQKQKLFETLLLLSEQGKTIIFVSHKLEDVDAICDRVAVLRRGELVGEALPPFDPDQLVEMMFSKVINLAANQPCGTTQPVLVLRDLSAESPRVRIDKVNFQVNCGEVVGLAGMEGSGQELLLRTCAGLVRSTHGRVQVNDQDLTGKPYRKYLKQGVAYLPAARLEQGLVPGLSLTEHFLLAEKTNGFFVNWDEGKKIARERISDFNIHGETQTTVEALSGGNQQRALLALLKTPLSLILLEHPTRGLDIESTIYIWSKLKDRCRQGTAIMFISSDLDEILRYSDRILVFFSGRVSPPLDASKTTVDQLGQLIGGRGWKETFKTNGSIDG
jgi:general nucleoside transport system ATP-binding protein